MFRVSISPDFLTMQFKLDLLFEVEMVSSPCGDLMGIMVCFPGVNFQSPLASVCGIVWATTL